MAYTFQDTEDAQVKKYFHLIGGEKRLENLQLFCQTHLASAPEDDPRHIPRDLVTQAASGSGFYEDHPARLPEMNPVGRGKPSAQLPETALQRKRQRRQAVSS